MRYHESDDNPMVSAQFTMAMIAVFIAVFAAQQTQANLDMLHSYPRRLGDGEIWRLITASVMHGSILHFGFNLYWFFQFSRTVERWLGPWIALAMYVAFAVGSGAPQALWSGGPAIGVSGVVYGLFGFLWVTRRRYDIAAATVTPPVIQIMLGWLVIVAVIGMIGDGLRIANTAHLFGLIFGWLLGQIVVARKRRRLAIIAGTVLLWLLLPALLYRPIYQRTLAHVPWLTPKYGAAILGSPEKFRQLERPPKDRGLRIP